MSLRDERGCSSTSSTPSGYATGEEGEKEKREEGRRKGKEREGERERNLGTCKPLGTECVPVLFR